LGNNTVEICQHVRCPGSMPGSFTASRG
jgi:hypothetical protein